MYTKFPTRIFKREYFEKEALFFYEDAGFIIVTSLLEKSDQLKLFLNSQRSGIFPRWRNEGGLPCKIPD